MKTKLLTVAAVAAMAASSASFADAIPSNGTNAYIIDSNKNVVRDGFGGCVRSIHWKPETAINACEGWPEPKPMPVAAPAPAPKPEPKPAPAPVAKPEIKPFPAVAIVPNEPAHFRGFFDFNSASLKASAYDSLNAYADYMKDVADSDVKVIGHTDSTGPEAYNQKLSERRAGAVKTYLEEQGIAADRISAEGKGETAPIASNATPEGRAENRRVEVQIVQ